MVVKDFLEASTLRDTSLNTDISSRYRPALGEYEIVFHFIRQSDGTNMLQSMLMSASRHLLRQGTRQDVKHKWLRMCRANASTSLSAARPIGRTQSSDRPFYITTPIFYVNAAPHVGHLYTMILSDVLKRYQSLKGRAAILSTGTDEHGMKVQQAAARAQTPTKEFCDAGAKIFQSLAARANISNEHFVRTTDEDHKRAVQHAWRVLQQGGHIYARKHEGWYCVSDETFYPETTIEKRLDPFNGRTFMASSETGKEVEWTSETNYHFRLSAFREPLLEFYQNNSDFIVPDSRMKDVVGWVTEGLEDLSISRPATRLTWGVPVPEDSTQTIYVWLDALMNYATKAGYPFAPGLEHQGGWPADVQVIGKDIVRFHCIYWPAFLMALGLPLPRQILTHAHWTLGKKKMAKSTGNVVNPFFAIDRFGVDVMRYFLMHDGGIINDANYDNLIVVERYKKGLKGGLGNLVSRVTRPKSWDLAEAVALAKVANDTGLTAAAPWNGDIADARQKGVIDSLARMVDDEFLALNPRSALHKIMDVVYGANRYLDIRAPWSMVRANEHRDIINNVVFNAAETVRVVGILLQPYMPEKASHLLDMLGVDKRDRGAERATYGADYSYGIPKAATGRCAYDSLFPPLIVET